MLRTASLGASSPHTVEGALDTAEEGDVSELGVAVPDF